MSRQVIVLISAIVILPKFFGINGILYAAPLADIVAATITGGWVFMELKRYPRIALER